MFLDLASTSWDQDELDAIQEVIDSDRFTMGPRVAEIRSGVRPPITAANTA